MVRKRGTQQVFYVVHFLLKLGSQKRSIMPQHILIHIEMHMKVGKGRVKNL
jgi:hypothetical protein